MRKVRWLFLICAVGLTAIPAYALTLVQGDQSKQDQTTLQIAGMIPGSASKVEALLKAVPGVTSAKAGEEMRAAVVMYDPNKVKPDDLIVALRKGGYMATVASTNYQCPMCKAVYSKDGLCVVCGAPLEKKS